MVTPRTRTWRCRGPGGAAGEAPVVDVDHVFGPLAGWKVSVLLETSQPVLGVASPDDEESPFFFADGESAFYLESSFVHSASTLPCSMSHPSDSRTACSEL